MGYSVSFSVLEELLNEMKLIRKELQTLNSRATAQEEANNTVTILEAVNKCHEGTNKLLYTKLSDKSIDLSDRTKNCLVRAGIFVVNDLTYCTARQIKHIRNLGKQTFSELSQFMTDNNITFADTPGCYPEINDEDKVVSLTDKERIPKGSVIVVRHAYPGTDNGYRFELPTYSCKFIENGTSYLSNLYSISELTLLSTVQKAIRKKPTYVK